MRRRGWPLALVVLLSQAAAGTEPAPPKEPDEELLEFLGSLDLEDESWVDYLERTDLTRVVRGRAPPPKPPEEKTPEETTP
jgi:hypothetical protein